MTKPEGASDAGRFQFRHSDFGLLSSFELRHSSLPQGAPMLNRGYAVFGALVLILYAVMGLTGWEMATPPREKMPPGARHASGGHSTSFWHSGFRGGK